MALDYDGDGRTDLAVRRRFSPSTFYVLSSSTGGLLTQPWGAPDDYVIANVGIR